MKGLAFMLLAIFVLACSSDDGDRVRNNFLVDVGFSVELNTNLPQYSALNLNGATTIVPNAGIRGVVIYTINSDSYVAYELSDPNHLPSACSAMTIDGITASCPCPDDINEYQVVTGQATQGGGAFAMKAYSVRRDGDIVTVFN